MGGLRLVTLVLGVVGLSSCSVPEPQLPDLPTPSEDSSGLVVIVHGSGDGPLDWPAALEDSLSSQLIDPDRWEVWRYDWEDDAAMRFVAAELGLLHGAFLGEALLSDGSFSEVHLIGHSAGSFVVHGVEQHFEDSDDEAPTLHSTYLDPFCGRGSDWSYGELHFGELADFSDAYFNRDDPVPSTNSSLEWAHNLDITDLKPDGISLRDGHWWPADFYSESRTEHQAGLSLSAEVGGLAVTDLHEDWPRGEETTLP